jgi:hypothetical protein
MFRIRREFLMLGAIFFLAGCAQKMADQPRYDPLVPSDFFANGQSARPLVADTVSRNALPNGTPLDTGKSNGKYVTTFPIPITRDVMMRGQERYDIFCSPCHDQVGTGNGLVVQRGYTKPPSFHTDSLRSLPDGQFFDVITNGFGQMPPYAVQIPVNDRWAIIAYVRALQLSQHAPLSQLSPNEQQTIQGMK